MTRDDERLDLACAFAGSAAAIRDNLRSYGADGIVIGTEYETLKAKGARANFSEAGLSHFIELREGDLRETLKDIAGPIDFMLIDIWTPMSRPALSLVAPRLRDGAVIISDNTTQFRDAYRDYFEFIAANRLQTMTYLTCPIPRYTRKRRNGRGDLASCLKLLS